MADRIIYSGGEGLLEEKRSRFLAAVRPVADPDEAMAFVAARRKEMWDARHHCFAYVIGDHGEITRCSDDGEPSGTAGRPILDVLTGEGLTNVLAVVTRYFGGVLLGTGGLVRAYSGAVREALSDCIILDRTPGIQMSVCTDYSGYGRIRYQLDQEGIPVTGTDFTDSVVVSFICREGQLDGTRKMLMETTQGTAKILDEKNVFFGLADGEAIIL